MIMGHKTEYIQIKVNRSSGLYAEYQFFGKDRVIRRRIDGKQEEEKEDKTKSLRKFNLKNEDFGMLSNDKLFQEIDKITIPEETEHYDRRIMDKPCWNLEIDGKKFFGNTEPEFYLKIRDLMKIPEVTEYIKNHFN